MNPAPWRAVCLCALTAMLLVACTGLRDSSGSRQSIDASLRHDALVAVDAWRLSGRVAVRRASGSGGQASLHWQQNQQLSALQLAGPFGAGRVNLEVAPQRISFADAAGRRSVDYTGADAAERFMADQLGWSFPVRSARYWMLGLLDPAAAGEADFNAEGLPVKLLQHGWRVEISRYAEFDGQQLPVKLVMENPQVRVKVAVNDWALHGGN